MAQHEMDAAREETEAEESDREIRVAAWMNYDTAGQKLPRRTLARQWRAIEVLAFTLMLVVPEAILTCFPNLPTYDPALVFVLLGVPTAFVLRRRRRDILQQAVGQPTADFRVVLVKLEIDGFEFGRDLGSISFESNWLHFEGEQSTFSLTHGDFTQEWKESRFTSGHSVLSLNGPQTGLKIHLYSVALNADLRKALGEWNDATVPDKGISVLPPLEKSPRDDFSRSQRVLVTWVIAGSIFAGTVVAALNAGVVRAPALLVGLLLAAMSAMFHRVYVASTREKAFERLGRIRAALPALIPKSSADSLEEGRTF